MSAAPCLLGVASNPVTTFIEHLVTTAPPKQTESASHAPQRASVAVWRRRGSTTNVPAAGLPQCCHQENRSRSTQSSHSAPRSLPRTPAELCSSSAHSRKSQPIWPGGATEPTMLSNTLAAPQRVAAAPRAALRQQQQRPECGGAAARVSAKF